MLPGLPGAISIVLQHCSRGLPAVGGISMLPGLPGAICIVLHHCSRGLPARAGRAAALIVHIDHGHMLRRRLPFRVCRARSWHGLDLYGLHCSWCWRWWWFPFFGPRLLGQQHPLAPSKQSRELASGPPSKLPRFPSRCPTGHGEVQTTFVGVNCRAMHV